jgi:pyruvate/2-oxoacid:ferredoxin oxidoreductase alpha subunit
MARQLIKGNVAAVKGALLSGCRAFYGYPITPASEVAEAAALYFPAVAGLLQAESEVAAINMVYGAAATGARVMTASSAPA